MEHQRISVSFTGEPKEETAGTASNRRMQPGIGRYFPQVHSRYGISQIPDPIGNLERETATNDGYSPKAIYMFIDFFY